MEEQIETVQEPVAGIEEGDDGKTQPAPDQDSGQDTRLNAGQMRLVEALAASTDIQAACKTADVCPTSAHRWLKQPAFQEELTRQRDAALGAALAAVKTHATRAVTELAGLMSDKDARLRRQVCIDILDRAVKIREMEDIERRLAVLEKAMARDRKRGSRG